MRPPEHATPPLNPAPPAPVLFGLVASRVVAGLDAPCPPICAGLPGSPPPAPVDVMATIGQVQVFGFPLVAILAEFPVRTSPVWFEVAVTPSRPAKPAPAVNPTRTNVTSVAPVTNAAMLLFPAPVVRSVPVASGLSKLTS